MPRYRLVDDGGASPAAPRGSARPRFRPADDFDAGMNDLDAFASGIADGISLGFGDEGLGLVRATGSALTGDDFGDAYRRSVFESRNRQDEAKRDHGGWFMGGQVAGSLAPALIPVVGQAGLGARAAATGARAAPGAFEMALNNPLTRAMFAPQGGIANRIASGALTGATFGGISGAGHADADDVGGAIVPAGAGAFLGAGLGAALPALFGAGQAGLRTLSRATAPSAASRGPVIEGAQSIVDDVAPPISPATPEAGPARPSNEALDDFIALLQQRGMSPEDAQMELNAFLANDPNRGRTFVDLLGQAGINKMKFLNKSPGTTADEAERVFSERNRGQLDRIESDLFDGIPSAHQTQKVVDDWYDTEGAALYEPLFQREVSEDGMHVFRTSIRRLMNDPVMERAAKKGQELLARDARVKAVREGVDLDTSDDEIARMAADIENARKASGTQPQTLTQFVRGRGGINDDRGDIATFGKDLRGFASVLTRGKGGMTADDMAEAASEAGFFPHMGGERVALREFIDALEDDVRGVRQTFARGGSADEANQADEVLNWYQSQGVDVSKRGSTLQEELRTKLLYGDADQIPAEMDTVGRRLHYIKMGLDAEIEKAARVEDSTTVRSLTDLKKLFVEQLDQVLPGYTKARNTWGGMAEAEDAIRVGRNLLIGRKSPEETAERIAELTPYQRTFARNGLMDELRRVLETTDKEGRRDVAEKLLGTRTGRLVEAIVGPKEAEKIRRVLSTESALFRTAQAASPRSGSDTGIYVAQALENAANRRTMTGAIMEMSGGVIDDILKNVRAGRADEAGKLLLQQIDDPNTAPEVRIFLVEVARRVKDRLGQARGQMGGSAALGASGATMI